MRETGIGIHAVFPDEAGESREDIRAYFELELGSETCRLNGTVRRKAAIRQGKGGDTVVVIVCALLAVGAIGFTLLVRDQDIPPAPVENAELKHQEARRQVLYDNLKDLQFEYHQGKLSDGDYQSLKAGFLVELAGTMDSIERLQQTTVRESKADAPAAKAKLKTKPAAASPAPSAEVKCPSCASPNPPSNRFCGGCGAALS